MESLAIESGIGRTVELADGHRPTQRHGGADAPLEDGAAWLDRFAGPPTSLAQSNAAQANAGAGSIHQPGTLARAAGELAAVELHRGERTGRHRALPL